MTEKERNGVTERSGLRETERVGKARGGGETEEIGISMESEKRGRERQEGNGRELVGGGGRNCVE